MYQPSFAVLGRSLHPVAALLLAAVPAGSPREAPERVRPWLPCITHGKTLLQKPTVSAKSVNNAAYSLMPLAPCLYKRSTFPLQSAPVTLALLLRLASLCQLGIFSGCVPSQPANSLVNYVRVTAGEIGASNFTSLSVSGPGQFYQERNLNWAHRGLIQ